MWEGEMMSDPISRLELARQEIDRVSGSGHARQHPEVVVAVMQTAASDWAASRAIDGSRCSHPQQWFKGPSSR